MQNINFRGCIPVEFYAKGSNGSKTSKITDAKKIQKCRNLVVRNLNKSIKNYNDEFVKRYSEIDSDYRQVPKVASTQRSDCWGDNIKTYLITGRDVTLMQQEGEKFGRTKADIYERSGTNDNRVTYNARKQYRKSTTDIINQCSRVKDEQGEDVVMKVLVKPEFNSKGELKGYKYQDVQFDVENPFI